jgi:hypothetical protein
MTHYSAPAGQFRRVSLRLVLLFLFCVAALCLPVVAREAGWRQVHPRWQRAFILSFRSPDLLSNEPDERWGASDGRLVSGDILSDFPRWLEEQRRAIDEARDDDRPILLSLHVHSGYGTGLVTYSPDLRTAEVANYPWLVRQLDDAGLNEDDVTVAIDTCNAQAAAAHQLRPDLVPRGIEAWPPMIRWRRAHRLRRSMPLEQAWPLFAADRVSPHLARPGTGRRRNVIATAMHPLTRRERRQLRADLYGPRGVILATPALFNLLRLGRNTRGTLTANLLRDPLERRVIDSYLSQNTAEFRRFREYAFLSAAGEELLPAPEYARPEVRRARGNRAKRVERGTD